MYMTAGVEMNTTTGGSLSSGFSRMLTGQNFFISDYTYQGETGSGQVALGTDFPSKILRLSVPEYGGKLVCQKGALLCASHTSTSFSCACVMFGLSYKSHSFVVLSTYLVDIAMEFSKNFSAGFFGGEGFILQVRSDVRSFICERFRGSDDGKDSRGCFARIHSSVA